MKKKLLIVSILMLILSGTVIIGFEVAKDMYFVPNIPEPDYPPPNNRIEAWQQDLDYFQHYIRLNRPYTNETRNGAMAIVDNLYQNIAILSDAELKLGIAEAIALSQNGHSAIWIPDLTLGEGRIPLLGRMFDDGYYFLWTTADYQHLIGAELVSIDGHPIEDVITAFRPYSGARENLFRMLVGWYLETPSLVHAVGFSNSPTGYVLGVRLMNSNEIIQVVIHVTEPTVSPPIVSATDIIAPIDMSGWEGLSTRLTTIPFALRQWDELFYFRTIEAANAFYIRYGANDTVGDTDIGAFNRLIESELSQNTFSAVILDQRFNGGGDYTRTHSLMSRLPQLAGEQIPIYVLTGPMTFSAAISSVAFLKASGGDQVTIIGTAMGDYERMWGETSSMVLPNSRLGMSLATGLHDYAVGCYEFPNCYWLDFFYNVAVGSLSPDVHIPYTFEDYIQGNDAAVEYIIGLHRN